MWQISHSKAQVLAAKASKRELIDPTSRDTRIVLVGVLLSAIALAYFYVVNNWVLTTRFMSQIFSYLLLLNDAKTAWLTFGVCVLAGFWTRFKPTIRIVDLISMHPIAISATAVVLLGFGAIFVYHGNAFSMDEYAAVFQAKTFAAGRLTAAVPPSVLDWLIPPGFNGAFLVGSHASGAVMEAYWPGFSLVLAPFELLGIPWLCNPLLAGIAVLAIYRITLEVTGSKQAAGWAILFAIASGVFAANAISYYSMQAHMTANMIYVLLLLNPSKYKAFAAGMVGSVALVLHNPFPHTMFAIPWIIAIGRRPEWRRYFLPLIAGYMPLVAFIGAGWLQVREHLTAGNSGFNVISNNVNSVFSFPDFAMINAQVADMAKLWVWAVPCLFMFAVLGRLNLKDDLRVRLLGQSALLTLAGYVFFIFDQGHGWGYRYFYSAWGTVPVLAACAMSPRSGSAQRLAAFAGAAAILNLLLVVPVQMTDIERVIHSHSAQLPPVHRPGNNIYFVQGRGFYAGDLVQIDPWLRSDDLILLSRGPALDAELRRQNWPGAVLVERNFGVEEWNLGAKDVRQWNRSLGMKQFVLSYKEKENLSQETKVTE